jgi:hypothetical protein
MLFGAAAFSAIEVTVRQIEAGGSAARLVPTLVVNVCIFTLLLIEVTLIVSRSRPVAKAPGVKPRLSALVGTWLIYLVVLLPVRVDLPAPMYYVSAVLATLGDLASIYAVMHLGRSAVCDRPASTVSRRANRAPRRPDHLSVVARSCSVCGAVVLSILARTQ